MQPDYKKLKIYLVLKAVTLGTGLLLALSSLAIQNSVWATPTSSSCAASQSITATSLVNNKLSTWIVSITLSEDTPTYSIEYRIAEDAHLQKGTGGFSR